MIMRILLLLSILILVGCKSNGFKNATSLSSQGPKATPSPNPSPTPKPSPSPTASPTPKPSPSPTASPTPQPSPTASPTPNPTPSPTPTASPTPNPSPTPPATGGYCSAGINAPSCGGEDNCKCFVALARALTGLPVDLSTLRMGSNNPVDIFTGGGSENIPVTCRAVKYVVDRDPQWFSDYFDAQLQNASVGFLGREFLSGTYQALNTGVVQAVLAKAIERNHTTLKNKASQWLRSYYALLSLMASSQHNSAMAAHHVDESTGQQVFNEETAPPAISAGYGLANPGNRSYVNNGHAAKGMQAIMLSMALAHSNRKYDWSLDNSPGYYGGLCVMLKTLGYTFNSSGKVNLSSLNPPASSFGLSDTDRNKFRNFIQSNGAQDLDYILDVLRPLRIKCELSIVRNEQGFIAWFGNETQTVGLCSRSKGGSFVAAKFEFSNRKTTSLSAATRQNQPEAARIWRENHSLCEETDNLAKRCIDFPQGNNVMSVYWGAGSEIRRNP